MHIINCGTARGNGKSQYCLERLKKMIEMNIDIRHENGHYAGYVSGELYCTGDTHYEVERELIEAFSGKGESHE